MINTSGVKNVKLLALQIIKSENGLEGTQWNKPTCDFLKKEFEKMLGLNDGQANA